MSYIAIRDRLAEVIGGISGLHAVSKFDPGKVSGYPCVIITPVESSDEILDTRTNERRYIFSVRLFEPIPSALADASAMEDRVMTLADSLVNTLDSANFSSCGVYFFPKIIFGGFSYVEREGGWCRQFELTAEFKKPVSLF
jgi:hypothetical protein